MESWAAGVIFLGLATLAAADSAAAESGDDTILLVAEESPPFNMRRTPDGEIVGISSDLLRAVFAEAGVRYRITLQPWSRAYSMALNNKNTCVYSTNRVPEREALFKWIGPLANNEWVLFGRKDGPMLQSLEQVRGQTIGGHIGDASVEFLKRKGFPVVEAPEDGYILKMLTSHRIEYWVDNLQAGQWLASAAGIEELKPVLKLRDAPLALACNRSVPDRVIELGNAILGRMQEDGTAAAIREKYVRPAGP